ncbi:hypothetical protein D9M71_256990 [compost metagenome]
MQNRELAAIFALTDQEQADAALASWASRRVGEEPLLLLAFLTMAPLLVENVAIRQWVNRHPQWEGALPEVLTVGEATRLAQADYMLNEAQTELMMAQLRML